MFLPQAAKVMCCPRRALRRQHVICRWNTSSVASRHLLLKAKAWNECTESGSGGNSVGYRTKARRSAERAVPIKKNRAGARSRSCALSNNANCFRIANLFQTIMKFFAPLSFKKAGKLPSFLFLFAVARARTPAAAAGAGTALFARADREKERSRDGEDEDRGDDHGGQIRLQPRHFYNAPPSRRTSSRTIPAKTHATAHWSKTTRVAQRTPSSRRIEAIAAIQGV